MKILPCTNDAWDEAVKKSKVKRKRPAAASKKAKQFKNLYAR